MVLRSRRRMIAPALAALLVVAAALLSACSDDDGRDRLLPRATASELRASLDAVEENVDTGNCQEAANQAAALRQQVDALPNRVATRLRRVLADGVDRLETLIGADCEPAGATTPTPVPPTEEEPEEEKPDKGKGKAKGKDKKQGEETPPENPPEGNPDDGGEQSDGGVEIIPDGSAIP